MLSIVKAVRQVHGDEAARAMLADGISLASLFKALLAAPMPNREAVRLVSRSFGDFAITPELGQAWHMRRIYSRPGCRGRKRLLE